MYKVHECIMCAMSKIFCNELNIVLIILLGAPKGAEGGVELYFNYDRDQCVIK